MIKSEFIVDFLNKCWKTNQSEKIKIKKFIVPCKIVHYELAIIKVSTFMPVHELAIMMALLIKSPILLLFFSFKFSTILSIKLSLTLI